MDWIVSVNWMDSLCCIGSTFCLEQWAFAQLSYSLSSACQLCLVLAHTPTITSRVTDPFDIQATPYLPYAKISLPPRTVAGSAPLNNFFRPTYPAPITGPRPGRLPQVLRAPRVPGTHHRARAPRLAPRVADLCGRKIKSTHGHQTERPILHSSTPTSAGPDPRS